MDPNLSPPDPNLSSPYLVHLAYIACGVLIIFYAWDRFSTPASNRSSTRQALYLWGCAGYIVSALGGICNLIGPTASRRLADHAAGSNRQIVATCTIHCDPRDDNAAFLYSGIETD